jgi:hypothetical protein
LSWKRRVLGATSASTRCSWRTVSVRFPCGEHRSGWAIWRV